MSAPAVSIGRLSATTHLEEGRAGDATRVDRLLGRVAAERLDRALRDVSLPPGIWCVRRLEVVVQLDLDRPEPALETAWAETMASGLRQALQEGSPEVIHYDHERDALLDLVSGAATGRLGPAWAWRRLGLLQPADPPLDRAAGEALVAVMDRHPRQALGAVLLAAERVGLTALQRVLGPAGWTAVAGVVRKALGAGPARPGRGEDPGTGDRWARAAALVDASRLTGLVSDSRVRLDPQTLDALALLVVAERDPAALRRPAGEALVAAVAGALTDRTPGRLPPAPGDPPAPGADPRAGADPGTDPRAGADLGAGADPGAGDGDRHRHPAIGFAPPPGDPAAAGPVAGRPPSPGRPEAAGPAGDEPRDPSAAGRAGGRSGDPAAGRPGGDPRDQAEDGSGAMPPPSAFGPAAPGPPVPSGRASRSGDPRRGRVADGTTTGFRASTVGTAAGAGPATTLGGHRPGSAETPGKDGSEPAETRGESGPRGQATEWAGLLFLLATAARAGVPDVVLDDPALAARPLPWALQGIALQLMPATVEDPAVAAFAATDPEGSPPWRLGPAAGDDELARLALIAHGWAAVTADALEEPGRDPLDVVASIARRDGLVDYTPGWLEVHLDIDQVDVAVRRAGLDLDPGWVPWLGSVVRFVYG